MLDEIEAAHLSVSGTARGRRYATQQINQAYAVLLSAQSQGYCRSLHSECLDFLLLSVVSPILQDVLRAMAIAARRLDTGNPTPGNIGSDFRGLGLTFWDDVYRHNIRNRPHKRRLDELNDWRNAIAHQDFTAPNLAGRTTVQLAQVRRWRKACDGLSISFDAVMRNRLSQITGGNPW